ncbi:MAG: sulfotransferase domain-containing protein, partial [Marinosulfonomonas sp.]|nr:sulfotransferase domain-containing protein [Marinosulfonomonas sp.]
IKIVALLRDPVKRAYSNHLHEIIKGHIPRQSFEEGLLGNPAYIDQGRYHTHLKRWYQAFGPDQMLVLIAEEIFADPATAMAQLYDFVGVDAGFVSAVASEARNTSDRARLPVLRRTLRGSGDLLRRVGLEEQLTRIKSSKPVAGLLRMNSVDVRAEVPPMTPATERKLTKLYEPEMLALAELLNRTSFPWATWDALTAAPNQPRFSV